MLFLAAIAAGTVLLALPISRAGAGEAPILTALFTATSAVAVTGLITVDTATYWSPFGQAVILVLFQIGGFGIMTGAVVLGLLAGRDIRLRDRLATQVERNRLSGNTRSVLYLAFGLTLAVEAIVAIFLAIRLHSAHDHGWGEALWHGLFHSVSAFNNAGFSSYSDSVMGFQQDAWILAPIMLAVILASLGFPVIQEMRNRAFAPRSWTLHTKITLIGTAALLASGFVAILASEWGNPDTLGPMGWGGKALNALFHSVMPRTAGFNSLDVGAFRIETLSFNYLLMFIGVGTVILLSVTPLPLSDALFETISAFSTVGLSTGITADLPPTAQLTLIVLMYVGRVGTITVATALALRDTRKPYRYPEENPIVG